MAKFPHLMKNRCGVYCYRLVLPLVIRAISQSPKEVRFSLGTKDKATAVERYLFLYPAIQQLVSSLLNEVKHGSIDMSTVKERIRCVRESIRSNQLRNEIFSAKFETARGRIKIGQLEDKVSQLHNEKLVLSGEVKAISRAFKDGAYIPATQRLPSMTLSELVDKFLGYEAVHSTNLPRTLSARKRYLMRLLDIVGHDLPIEALSAEHLRHYRDLMHAIPKNFDKQGFRIPAKKAERPAWFEATITQWDGDTLSGGGIETGFNCVRALLNWATAEHHITADLTSLLVVSKKRSVETKVEAVPFSTEQLECLFTSGYLYGDSQRKYERPHDWQFWIPLFGLTTGMRSSEIGALKVNDLAEQDRIWCIRINDSKTQAGIRTIPVPQRLINTGLLDYRQALIDSEGEDGRLFPTLTQKGGQYSNRIGAFFNYNKNSTRADGTIRYDGYMVKTDVSSPSDTQRQSFHSLRHGLITQILETRLPSTGVPLPLDLIKNLVGHGIDFSKTYGIATDSWDDVTTATYNHRDHAPLKTQAERLVLMKEALDTIDFGTDLSGISFARFKARKKPITIIN